MRGSVALGCVKQVMIKLRRVGSRVLQSQPWVTGKHPDGVQGSGSRVFLGFELD